MPPQEARRTLLNTEDLIFKEEKVWVPLEVTLVQDDFLMAWEKGADEWREFEPGARGKIYPTRSAWELYQPAGLPGESRVNVPEKAVVINTFQNELETFINREIFPKVERLKNQIVQSNNSPKYTNRLGVLYAKYGMLEKAVIEFEKAGVPGRLCSRPDKSWKYEFFK